VPPCVVTHDAGTCLDGGTWAFDGEACVPHCGGAYADESACSNSCLCAMEKLQPQPFTAESRCMWVEAWGVIDGGVPDAGPCFADGPLFFCRWFLPLGEEHSSELEHPLEDAGVRLACEWSVHPDVFGVFCVPWGE
jgi:hypothetical protein